MVSSVLPFLMVISNPDLIGESRVLNGAYTLLGFGTAYQFLLALGLGVLAVVVLSNAVQMLRTYAVVRFTTRCGYSFSSRLLTRYLRQPYEFFLNRHTGTMAKNILGESNQAVGQFYLPAADLVTSAITALAILGLLLAVNPLIVLIAALVFGLAYGLIALVGRHSVQRAGEARVAANKQRFRIANETLGGVKDLKVLGREAAAVQRFRAAALTMADAQITVRVFADMPRFLMQVLVFSGIILLCLILLDPAQLEAGTALRDFVPVMGVFVFASQRLMPALQRIYAAVVRLRAGQACIQVLHEDMLRPTGSVLPAEIPAPTGLKQSLALDRVSYRYPGADRAGLDTVSLTVTRGEKLGIVGSTGAGKTTLADIVLGLLRPADGQLVVDGVAVTEDNLRAWQQSVGYVPQSIFLSDATIAQNIAFGVAPEEIDPARIAECAAMAQLDEFIRSDLPEGYDTIVGERGVRLSGGQRQRIGIARALYHDADLILFDEATSALDNLTEREVMRAIEALPGDKTVLMIAHRLSTVRICDRILLLERGRVAGLGSWDELIQTNAAFRRLVDMGAAA